MEDLSSNSHITIQPRTEVPQPVLHRDGKLFCCPFCTETQFKPARKDKVEDHLDGHHNRAVVLKGLTIHRCGLGCKKKLHYHCSYCPQVIFKRNDFLHHLQMCKKRRSSALERTPPLPLSARAPPLSSPAAPASSLPLLSGPAAAPPPKCLITTNTTPPLASGAPPPASDVEETAATLTDSALEVTPAVPRPQKRARPRPVVQKRCPFCDILINKFNLKRHIERKHTKGKTQDSNARGHLTGEIIDKENGIYAVLDVSQGHSIPVHVQLKTSGTNHHFLCEHSQCQIYMDVAHLCQHVRSATYITSPAQAESLSPFVLDAMVTVKWFGQGAKDDCLKRQELAYNNKVPLSVHTVGLPETNKCISVYEPTISHYSRIGRVMVVYDTKTNTWTCPCTNLRQSCIHVDIAKWHLFQTQRSLFRTVRSTEEIEIEITEEEYDCSSGIKSEEEEEEEEDSCPVYPPKGAMLQEMVSYIQKKKKIPAILPEDIGHPVPHGEYPSHLVPDETHEAGESGQFHTEEGAHYSSQAEAQTECISWCVLRRAELNRLLEENRALRRELEEYKMSEGFLRR